VSYRQHSMRGVSEVACACTANVCCDDSKKHQPRVCFAPQLPSAFSRALLGDGNGRDGDGGSCPEPK